MFQILLLALLLPGCRKEEDRYNIDPTLAPYLQQFLTEASQRGIALNPKRDGLVMEFAKLKYPTIGLCTYSDPLLVQIDPDYWRETAQYDDRENLRQNVVFHELAHGLLNRPHTNATLPNTEWKSLMCGGTILDDRSWSVNFNGYRKQYYLDELFNLRQPAPEWSLPQQFSGEKGRLLVNFDLSTDKHRVDASGNRFTIHDGIYTIESNSKTNLLMVLSDAQITSDHYFEMEMMPASVGSGLFGIFISSEREEGKYAANYFSVLYNEEYRDFRAYAANVNCSVPFAEVLLDNRFDFRDYNKFAIERRDGEFFFYLNDELIYRNDWGADAARFRDMGVIVPSGSAVHIRSAACYVGGGSTAATPPRAGVPVADFSFVPHSVAPLPVTDQGCTRAMACHP